MIYWKEASEKIKIYNETQVGGLLKEHVSFCSALIQAWLESRCENLEINFVVKFDKKKSKSFVVFYYDEVKKEVELIEIMRGNFDINMNKIKQELIESI